MASKLARTKAAAKAAVLSGSLSGATTDSLVETEEGGGKETNNMINSPYEALFTACPLGINRDGEAKLTLPHRTLMAPTYMGWEQDETFFPRIKLESDKYWEHMAAFYEARVKGGCFLVTSGMTAPSLLGRWRLGALSLTTNETAKGYKIVTDAVHKAGGKMMLQIVHAGRSSMQPIGLSAGSDAPFCGHPYGTLGLFPTKAPQWGMNYLLGEYERACKLAVNAGFDGVEISAADGTFLHNFLCAEHNRRAHTDRYSGTSIETRTKILLDVLERVHYGIPKDKPDFLISCRISVLDLIPGGNALWETQQVAETVAKSGMVDFLTTSVGMKDSVTNFMSSHVPKAAFARCVKAVRDHLIEKECFVPVAASHRIPDPETAENLLQQGVCDFVQLSRPLLADPEWVNKARKHTLARDAVDMQAEGGGKDDDEEGGVGKDLEVVAAGSSDASSSTSLSVTSRDSKRIITGPPENRNENAIIPCIYCNHCVDKVFSGADTEFIRPNRPHGQRVSCAVNPKTGFELSRNLVPTKNPKSIFVVGAGPAGITCALTLSRRGHTVVLYEKSHEIGGQLNLAKRIPGKENYWDLLDYWAQELRESNVIVKTGVEFTEFEISNSHQHCNHMVLCMGSQPKPMDDKYFWGSQGRNVVPYEKVLTGEVKVGNKVIIMGAGPIAWDVASYLLHDHEVCKKPLLYSKEHGFDLENGVTAAAPTCSRKNNRLVTMFERKDLKQFGTQPSVRWFQKRWAQQHGMVVIKGAMFHKIDEDKFHFSIFNKTPMGGSVHSPLGLDPTLTMEADSFIWCQGQIPNYRFGQFMHEWIVDGAKDRGLLKPDFTYMAAGSCRDGSLSSDQDLHKCIHEGYMVGMEL